MNVKRLYSLTAFILAYVFLGSCGGEKKTTASSDGMLYGIPINTISVKGVTESNITGSAFWKVPLDPGVYFFKKFDGLKSELKLTDAKVYRTNDIRILVQNGKRQLFIDKSGTMHEGDNFYQMNDQVNNLIKSISPDSLKQKLSYDFLVVRR
jgi:hypothetical protein